MIRTALEFIKTELDAFIADRENDPGSYSMGNISEVSGVVEPSGGGNRDDDKHISITLCGLEEERREGKRPVFVNTADNKLSRLNPPVEISLFVLFSARSADYPTALRDLSSVVAFFQSTPVFDEMRFPNLNSSVSDPNKPWRFIERLSFRLYNLTFEQQNNLWTSFGGKYLPSAVYKMTLLTVFDRKPKQPATPITEMGIQDN